VLARALKAPFAAAGVKAIGRNHAMGGTTALPFGWCAETMLGSHPDVVGWDYNMMEGGRWAVRSARGALSARRDESSGCSPPPLLSPPFSSHR
jgi:hypothetical protein